MLLLMNLFFSTVYEKGISFRGKDEILYKDFGVQYLMQ